MSEKLSQSLTESHALAACLQSLLETIRHAQVLEEFLDWENTSIQAWIETIKQEVTKIITSIWVPENFDISEYKQADEPNWMAEIRILQKIWKIPEYRWKKLDGDAYEWYKKHFLPWENLMDQKNLMKLMGRKLLDGIRLSAKELGLERSDLIPPSTQKKT